MIILVWVIVLIGQLVDEVQLKENGSGNRVDRRMGQLPLPFIPFLFEGTTLG